ncbi:hypothetical protein [Pseudomonas baetica]|uniref:hypothetical protein n=1 Tax=Pseudomonas baetica TaxID=674054 RepID=UPI002406AEB0|nr:hypothetical protein [Pseudomonas baetica]MDF9778930.1 hypothetical protein [Pseudomonas baetica]
MTLDDEIQKVLSSPGTSYWLRQALEQALDRDCVDAANDAEYLSDLLARRCLPSAPTTLAFNEMSFTNKENHTGNQNG